MCSTCFILYSAFGCWLLDSSGCSSAPLHVLLQEKGRKLSEFSYFAPSKYMDFHLPEGLEAFSVVMWLSCPVLLGLLYILIDEQISCTNLEAVPFPQLSQCGHVLLYLRCSLLTGSWVMDFTDRAVPEFTASCSWALPYHKGIPCHCDNMELNCVVKLFSNENICALGLGTWSSLSMGLSQREHPLGGLPSPGCAPFSRGKSS